MTEPASENVLSSPMAASLLFKLKAECEAQHARAEAAEAELAKVRAEGAALVAAQQQHVAELLSALKLMESVYRQNCVAPGEPSSVLDAVQAAIAKAEAG